MRATGKNADPPFTDDRAPEQDLPRAPAAGTIEKSSIRALALLLELRDGYAAADAEHMVDLACEVGRRLGLTGPAIDELLAAARLHDIGKIGVPDRILHKSGKLDPQERSVMQRHPVWGAQALAGMPGMTQVAELVRSHHERWDGQGYPAGLEGDAIPLGARVVGLCEAYRAMTSDRPYRRSLDPGHALSVLVAARGTNFDPEVIDALVGVLAERAITPRRGGPALTAPGSRAPESAARNGMRTRGYGRHLTTAFEQLESMPALSEARDRLLSLLVAPAPSGGDIVSAVEGDLALAVAVLRVANGRSTRRSSVASIPDAVSIVSPEGVEMLASRIAVVDLFERRSERSAPPEAVRRHALATQRAAVEVAGRLGFADRDELMVSALLHDIGKLALDLAHPGYPAQVHGDAQTPDERVRAEQLELGLDHAVVGGMLLRRWGLPDRLAAAVEHHHRDDAEGEAAILRLADMLAHHGHGAPVGQAALGRAARSVGLGADDLRGVIFELAAPPASAPRRSRPCPLTPMQLRVIRELAQGKVYKEIAADLKLSPSTVRSHLHGAYDRLGVSDRAQAVLMCANEGWL